MPFELEDLDVLMDQIGALSLENANKALTMSLETFKNVLELYCTVVYDLEKEGDAMKNFELVSIGERKIIEREPHQNILAHRGALDECSKSLRRLVFKVTKIRERKDDDYKSLLETNIGLNGFVNYHYLKHLSFFLSLDYKNMEDDSIALFEETRKQSALFCEISGMVLEHSNKLEKLRRKNTEIRSLIHPFSSKIVQNYLC